MVQLQPVSPPVVHHVKYLETHEVTVALKRGAWSRKRSESLEIRDAVKGSLLFTWRTNMSEPCECDGRGRKPGGSCRRWRIGAPVALSTDLATTLLWVGRDDH